MLDLIFQDVDTLLPGGIRRRTSVGVADGRIAAISAGSMDLPTKRTIKGGDRLLVPGAIDPHIHYGYHPDDALTETRSAALGGVTTMLRYHRKTNNYEDLDEEIADINARSYCNVGMHLTLMVDSQAGSLESYVEHFGVSSFKMLTGYRGYASLNIVESDDAFILSVMRKIAAIPGAMACIHCENTDICEAATADLKAKAPDGDLALWNASRPAYAEGEAVMRMGYLARIANCPLYIVHITCREALESLKLLRRNGQDVKGETCMHYLTLDERAPLIAKVAPPLRTSHDVEALWEAVADGTIDTIGTDHSPRGRMEKTKPTMWDTTVGNVGVGTLVPLLIDEGYRKRAIPLEQLYARVSENPSKIFHLPGKGRVEVGADADLVLLDLNEPRTVTPGMQGSMSDYSLYEGRKLRGWPAAVMVMGTLVAEDGAIVCEPGVGRYVSRPPIGTEKRV